MNEKDALAPANGDHGTIKYSTGGVFDSVEQIAAAIRKLSEAHNVLVPGGAIGAELPLLHAAAMSFVFVDPIKETYAIPGKANERGIGKSALDRIARAAGVRWTPQLCGRVDDGSDPHVVEYQAAGSVMQLDGTESMIHASKRIDLRADQAKPVDTWGAESQEIARQAGDEKSPWPRILQARQHILSLAESKAKNRAIRSLGVRTSYSVPDLAKGFLVLRLQFTGHSDDPEVQKEIELMIARRALGATSALYGAGETTSRPAARVTRLAEVVEDEPETKAAPAAAPAEVKAPEAAPAQALAPKAEAAPERKTPPDNPSLICGPAGDEGKYPRKPCSEFTVDELREKIAYAEKSRPKWQPRWAAKNEAELIAMKAWLAFKEFDPRQGVLPGVASRTDVPDGVSF